MKRRTAHTLAAVACLAFATTATAVPATADADPAYAAAIRAADAAQDALVRARQQAAADYRATPAYATAARELSAAFDAYAQRRNAIMLGLDQHDPRIAAWRKGVDDADAQVARDGQNPAVSPEAFGELLKQRAGFVGQIQAAEDDAVDRQPDAKDLRQKWRDASAKLADAQAKQAAAVDATPAVRAALAAAADARAAVDRAAATVPAAARVDDPSTTPAAYVRRYPRHDIGWADVAPPAARPPGK